MSDYYEKRYHETNQELMDAYRQIGALKFRVNHLFEALKRIAECDDLGVARAIARARIDLCSDWYTTFADED